MLPELGYLALLLAASLAVVQGTAPWIGLRAGKGDLIRLAWPLAGIVFLLQLAALTILTVSFALDDFSIAYVAQHSNNRLPPFFKLAAVWGGHEGSMLFFVFAISMWTALVAVGTHRQDPAVVTRVLAVMGIIVAAFSFFTLVASNPFERQFPVPFEGRDLNPMLQDIALIFHPPLLYLGYVGFSVNFAYAFTALLTKRLDGALIRWSRPWALASWAFLTLGIALGSWWAYYELGWGGWWFWDPVENASLLPWLLGTALLHVMIVCEKRGAFGHAVVLMSIFTFALSLLGTFLVRSGILSSVHAFAIDPGRGIPLLLILGVLLTLALSVYALRAQTRAARIRFDAISRESLLGLCGALLCVATLCILLGTFFPLLYKLFGGAGISVGAPYFNRIFVPLCLLTMLALPLAPVLRWKRMPQRWIRRQMPFIVIGILAGAWLCLRHDLPGSPVTLTACVLACWAIATHAAAFVRERGGARAGMLLAHLGVACAVIGAAQVSQYTEEQWAAMKPGETHRVGKYNFTLESSEPLVGPNYTAERLVIRVDRDGRPVATLTPERRRYTVRAMDMNETGIGWGILGDLYAVAGEKIPPDAFLVHLQYRPMVRWIWFGAVLMAAGAFLVLFRRSRRKTEENACAA